MDAALRVRACTGRQARGGRRIAATYHHGMSFTATSLIGFFLGFAFGVGCALAVMYSIFLGGYRAALRDSQRPEPPERYRRALAHIVVRPALAAKPPR